VPKIMKSCLNLSKLRPKYTVGPFFTGHDVYAVTLGLQKIRYCAEKDNRI